MSAARKKGRQVDPWVRKSGILYSKFLLAPLQVYLIRLMSVSMMYAAGSESPHPTPLNTLPMSMNGKEEAVVTKIQPVSSTEKKTGAIQFDHCTLHIGPPYNSRLKEREGGCQIGII